MKQFKNTVPLMVSLKNEALRQRHWQQLMEKTGRYFDMAPDRFTLDNMFSMQLHKYQVCIFMYRNTNIALYIIWFRCSAWRINFRCLCFYFCNSFLFLPLKEIAEAILNNAIKELAIERGVKEIEEVWSTMAFKVIKHIKGTEERGWILGPTDEIAQVIEDNAMNLQSMAASQ